MDQPTAPQPADAPARGRAAREPAAGRAPARGARAGPRRPAARLRGRRPTGSPIRPARPGPRRASSSPGYGARIIAYIIDSIISASASGSSSSWRSCSAAATRAARWRAILIGFSILLGVVYFPYFWQRDGQTPGMSMFDIRVVRDEDGGKVDWLHAILRFIGYGINSIVFGLPIGWLWVFVDKRRRGWMDLIGSTVVVKS